MKAILCTTIIDCITFCRSTTCELNWIELICTDKIGQVNEETTVINYMDSNDFVWSWFIIEPIYYTRINWWKSQSIWLLISKSQIDSDNSALQYDIMSTHSIRISYKAHGLTNDDQIRKHRKRMQSVWIAFWFVHWLNVNRRMLKQHTRACVVGIEPVNLERKCNYFRQTCWIFDLLKNNESKMLIGTFFLSNIFHSLNRLAHRPIILFTIIWSGESVLRLDIYTALQIAINWVATNAQTSLFISLKISCDDSIPSRHKH